MTGLCELLCHRAAIGSMRKRLIFAAFFMLGIAAPHAASAQMTVPGSFGVATSGAATYAIPIAVPPGTAGVVPSLMLDYNSQAPNGILGVGWSLSGLPSIGRCPQTFAQDGVRGAVNYNSSDRFCLDGQRLMALNTATYGADGTEYRTEIDSFSRVISHGGATASGPAWFEVHTKAGQIMEFGHTTDSLALATGKSTARSWAVNKVSDTKGNYFTVTYHNDTVTGQVYPTEVDYTGNVAASLAPYNKVQFGYASRTDWSDAYQAGSFTRTAVLLTEIKTFAGASPVADYKLAYSQGYDTARSHLNSVTLCDGGTTPTCLPPTTFTWSDNNPGTFVTASTLSPPANGWTPYFGDFNGDGKTDVLWCNANYANGNSCYNPSQLWLSNGDGTFTTASTIVPPANQFLPFLGDFNGDGRTDILWCNANSANGNSCGNGAPIWLSNGDGTFTTASNPNPPGVLWTPYLGDFNGDGRTDVLWCNANHANGNSCGNPVVIWLSNGDGTFSTISSQNPPAPLWLPYLGDFNGDGKTDILWCNANYANGNSCYNPAVFWFSNGDGTFTTVSTINPPAQGWTPYLGDFNGDGKADILWCAANYTYGNSCGNPAVFWFSNGDGTFTTASSINPPAQFQTPYIMDFNGDGRSDIMWCNSNAANGNSCANPSVFWASNGNGSFATVSSIAPPANFWMPYPGDFNGDGKTDIFWCNANNATGNSCYNPSVFWLSVGPSQNAAVSDLLTGVNNGIGATTTITYLPLTNSSIYTRDTGFTYPVQNLQPPVHVVSRVDKNNGVGGSFSTSYTYAGSKLDLSGYGPLGFRQMTMKDLLTNISQTSSYRQDFPYIGQASSITKVLGAQTLSQTSNTYQFSNFAGNTTIAPGNAPYRVSLAQSVSQGTDLDGTALPITTTSYQYDAYNNATQVTVSTPDGYSKATTNTYNNDTVNWYLGRLLTSQVASSAPQQLGQYCTTPWGATITNGQSVTAYSASTAPVGQTCSAITQTRTCTNGTLSGSFSQQSCSPASCSLPWGGSIASGANVTAFSAANPPVGQACTTISQTRSCSLGVLSGSYANGTCSAVCAVPWGGTTGQGQNVTAFTAAGVPAPQSCSTVQQTRTCQADGTLSGSGTYQSCVVRQPKTVFLTSGSSWTVPSDWNNSINKIEVIGGGGSGGVVYSAGGGGGGGGAYSAITNLTLTPGAAVSYNVGLGGVGGYGEVGNNTWFNGSSLSAASVSAQGGPGGLNNTVGGVNGGQASAGIGTTKYSGGAGGVGGYGGGGGGGGAGPHGAGGAGGNYSGGINTGGGGGGGADGGSAGGNDYTLGGSTTPSGAGGNNWQGSGGGSGNCVTGSAGGGGSGGYGYSCGGGGGSMDTAFDASHGSGGGGGGGGSNYNTPGRGGAPGSIYGGGGGGGGSTNAQGGNGANGLIVITYTPGS